MPIEEAAVPPPLTEAEFDPFAGGVLELVAPTTEPQKEIWLAAKMQPEASRSASAAEKTPMRFQN